MKKFLIQKLVNIHTSKWLLAFIFISAVLLGNSQTWTLQQCIDTALVHNNSLQISRNNIALGNEKQKEAKSNIIPKINLTSDYKYFVELPYQIMPMSAFGGPEGEFKEIQFGVPHNINASVQASLPLYNPQIAGGIRNSKIASQITEIQYRKTEEELFFEISNLYYNAQILQHQLAFIDSNIVNTSKLLENLRLLHTQLMVKATDVSKVELQKEQLLTQQQLIKSNIDQVISALRFTMGLSADVDISVETDIRTNSLDAYSNLATTDEQLVNAQNRLLQSEMKTLKTSRLPSLSAYGSYSQIGFGYNEKPNDFLNFHASGFVGVQLSVPLFGGMVTSRKISQKSLEIQNNTLQIGLINEQKNMQVENAIQQRNVAHRNITNGLSQISIAKTIYEQTLLQQTEGTAGLTEVLLADNALREAQQNYLTVMVTLLKTDLELKKLTGNLKK